MHHANLFQLQRRVQTGKKQQEQIASLQIVVVYYSCKIKKKVKFHRDSRQKHRWPCKLVSCPHSNIVMLSLCHFFGSSPVQMFLATHCNFGHSRCTRSSSQHSLPILCLQMYLLKTKLTWIFLVYFEFNERPNLIFLEKFLSFLILFCFVVIFYMVFRLFCLFGNLHVCFFLYLSQFLAIQIQTV